MTRPLDADVHQLLTLKSAQTEYVRQHGKEGDRWVRLTTAQKFVAKAEARAVAAEVDARRLDALEAELTLGGPIVLHNGEGTKGSYRGLGLANTGRTLRQAIDECCGLDTEQPRGEVSEPEGWGFQHDETGMMTVCMNDGINTPEVFLKLNPRYSLIGPLYAQPRQSQPVVVSDALQEMLKEARAAVVEPAIKGDKP